MKTYYGEETRRALENFPFSIHVVQQELITALVEIKKAAALANEIDGGISQKMQAAIVGACDEVLQGKHREQFVTPAVQGGAGTSINMNVCEVLAARATEILAQKGQAVTVHPLDHINKSQSTNDVNPSALKIAAIRLTQILLKNMQLLEKSLLKKAEEYKAVSKLARTHLQDAVPTTLGAEFSAYASLVNRHQKYVEAVLPFMHELNLGGTAIGNGINASAEYKKFVYEALRHITRLPVKPAANLMSQTSSQSDFVALINCVSTYLVDISKIANDIRLMVSGPKGGFAELKLPEMQKGSTIMPGKVNPVIAEVVNQVYYYVTGQGVTIQMAARAAQFELANMLPVVADALIISLRITSEVTHLFATKCIDVIAADAENCLKHLEESTAYATLLTKKLGYDTVAQIVKEATVSNKTLRQITLEKKLLTEAEFDALVQVGIKA